MNRIKFQLYAIEMCAFVLLLGVLVFFFQRFSLLAQEKQEIYLSNSLSQAAQGVEGVLDDIRSVVEGYAYSEPVQALLRAPRLSSEMLGRFDDASRSAGTITDINQDIVGFAIVPLSGVHYSFGLPNQYRYLSALRPALLEQRSSAFDGALNNAHGDQSAYFTYQVPIFSTTQGPEARLGEFLGVCVAFCEKRALSEVLDAALMEGMSIELRTASDAVLTVRQPGAVRSGQTVTTTYSFGAPTWTLIQRYDSAPQRAPYPALFGAALVISLGVLALLSLIVHRNFAVPITRINEELTRIAQQPLEAEDLVVSCTNELGSIAQSVNALLRRLRKSHRLQMEQETHMLRAQLSVNRLQLQLLQNQINPHFLYNTLACIRGIALSHGVRVIADMVTNMAALYRYSIKGGTYARLAEETDIARRYLDIMNLRTDNRLRASIDLPDDLRGVWTPKMILQPLVENAVLHGLECRQGGGEVKVRVFRAPENGDLLVTVEDDGAGMPPETVSELNRRFAQPERDAPQESGHGMGMLNVHRKIRLHNGGGYGLRVESEAGRGTRVAVRLPLLDRPPEGAA